MNYREEVYLILNKINSKGGYSTDTINKNASSDFVRQAVYGVLENQILIDYMINKISKVKVRKMDKEIREILRLSFYELFFKNKVEEYAVVNEAVKLVQKYSYFRYKAFVNGILRNALRYENLKNVDIKDETERLSTVYSHNSYITENLTECYGYEICEKILKANNEKPLLHVRVNKLKISAENLKVNLKKLGYFLKRTEFEDLFIVENPKNIFNTEDFIKGNFTVQDKGSYMASLFLAPKENSKVLDICASPGGKTCHLAQIMNNSGEITANDLYTQRLELIKENVNRLGVTNVHIRNFDATVLNEKYLNYFDYILLDAPCSSTGIIRKKPEIKLKGTEDECLNLVKIQREIFQLALKYLKVGGFIVYSTCSILNMENEDNLKYFLDKNENIKLIKSEFKKNADFIKLLPFKDNCDGFFICKFQKNY